MDEEKDDLPSERTLRFGMIAADVAIFIGRGIWYALHVLVPWR